MVNTRREIKTLFTGYFQPMWGRKVRQNAVLSEKIVDKDIYFQVYLKDEKGRARGCFQNTLQIDMRNNKIFFLGSQYVWKGIFHSWKSFIRIKVMNKEWMIAFHTCLRIYQGKNKMFAEVPTEFKLRREKMNRYILKLTG